MKGRVSSSGLASLLLFGVAVGVGLCAASGVARAQAPAEAPPAAAPGADSTVPAGTAMPTEIPAAPPGPEAQPPSAIDAPPLAGALLAAPTRGPNVSYGLGIRWGWVSVPKWMLNLFTKKNVPLSSFKTFGVEFLRRKGEFDFILSLAYQDMSPPDGNWLGRSHAANVDTDYVQFKGLGLAGIDASFVWHSYLSDWFGLHYGAGLGIGIVTGKMLRTSSSVDCTDGNVGDLTKCHPLNVPCTANGCSDAALAATEGGVDDPTDPHRFRESNVPPALPIVNVILGMDFRLPRVRGWEAKFEGGFYDAFFIRGGAAYTF
jgi:hypothetical protein